MKELEWDLLVAFSMNGGLGLGKSFILCLVEKGKITWCTLETEVGNFDQIDEPRCI